MVIRGIDGMLSGWKPGGGGSPGRRQPSSPVLIGRDAELASLAEAASDPPALALVEGEAGVGKSRLVRELAGDARIGQRRVLLGHCHRLPQPFPLGPIIEALRGVGSEPLRGSLSPLLGVLRPLLPELAGVLPPRPDPLSDSRAERHRLFRAIRELLGVLGPTLCILEDLHWADEGTLELLCFMASALPSELTLVLTCRRDELDPSSPLVELSSCSSGDAGKVSIGLTPLCPRQVRDLVAAVLESEAVSPEFADRMHEWTAGIPFAIEEVLRLLLERGDLPAVAQWPGTALDELEVPRAIRDSVLSRLASVSQDAQLVAWAAAVLDGPVEEGLVIEVAGLPAARGATALTEALSAGSLEERGHGLYGFRHALAAQAVYENAPGPTRRALHLRAGRALQSRSGPRPLEQIAHHMKEGHAPKWPLYAEAAAKAASCAGDDGTAARLLEDALAAPALASAARIRIAIALGEAAVYSVSPQNAALLLRRVLAEEKMPTEVRGELRFSLSRLLGHAGDSSWRRECVLAIDELEGRPGLAARAMVNLAREMSAGEGRLDEHLAWLDRAVETAGRNGDAAGRIAVHAHRATILLMLGDRKGWAMVRDIPCAGGSVAAKLQLLRGYYGLGMSALILGHYERAESFMAEAERLQAELGRPSWDLSLGSARAALDWASGRWQGLEDRLRGLLNETRAMPGLYVSNRFNLGCLRLARGDLEEAERDLAVALEGTDSLLQVVAVSGRLARLHLDREEPGAACRAAGVGLDAVRRKGVWTLAKSVAPEAAQALVQMGELCSARELTREFAAGLRERDAPAARAALSSCRGAVAQADGRHPVAARHFARAERDWARLPNRYEAARARERRACCLLASRDARGAEVLLGALEAFESLGAERDAGRVRTGLKAARAWRGGRKGYGKELSPREAQVARLAGMGHTNREIADALFISSRTVEAHVAASLRKLGLASRGALAALVRGDGSGKDR